MVWIGAQLVPSYALEIPFLGTQQHITLGMLLKHLIYKWSRAVSLKYTQKRSTRIIKSVAFKTTEMVQPHCFQ